MKLVALAMLILIQLTKSFDDDFYPPILPKQKLVPADTDQPAPIFLGQDEESGCYCREAPEKWVVCYGRETCKKFPKNVIVKLNILRIKGTLINILNEGDLGNWTHLTTMQIEGAVYLNKIESGVFVNMTNLTNLSISYCTNLQTLEMDTFFGLFNLKELYLVQNGFINIEVISSAFRPSILPQIKKLVLSENYFREVNAESFQAMKGSTLRELNLVLCQIEYIHPETLIPLKNLRALRIGENAFNISVVTDFINNTIKAGIPLRLLNLYSLGFRKTPPKELLETISESNITNLCLARNQFEVIKDNSFPEMENLEILDLREVLALNITQHAFSGMPKLRTLLLSGNKLSSIPEGVLLQQLTYLDLSANSGNSFYPSYFSLGKSRFQRMKNLQLLNLSFNRVTSLFNHTFIGLSNLLVLGLKNATIFYIAEESFLPLNNLLFLNLENNPFTKNHPLVKGIFKGLGNLQVLLLGGCSITYFDENSPFKYLVSLKHLGLERNKLHVLHSLSFIPLRNLETLDLSQNTLRPWQERLLIENIKIKRIIAVHNKFTYLSQAMLHDFENLQQLDLTDNPFTCDCTTFNPIQKWLFNSSNNSILSLLEENPADCVYPDKSKNLTLPEYLKMIEMNPTICETTSTVIIILPVVLLIVIIIGLVFLIYFYRWHVRYWIFLTRIALNRRLKIKTPKPIKQSHTNYQYDAFVSYSNEDRNFVIRLVSMLENYEPFLKLCVYERDFQVGSVISESILDSVVKSRKTLLIVSDSYARSQWCRWEAQIAEHHRLFFEKDDGEYVDDSLILVKLGPVSELHITPTLKYLLKTRIYLQWDSDLKKQKLFWDKLRNALAPPKNNVLVDSSNV